MIRCLKDLVAPLSVQEFREHFSRKDRLFVKTAKPKRAVPLLPWTEINHLIDSGSMPSSLISVVLKGTPFPEFMYRHSENQELRSDALHRLAAQGASILLDNIDLYVPAIATLADSIERFIAHRVWVNCYITFGKTSAFKPHYDTHDVLVLQIYGAKRWRGYGLPIEHPVSNSSPKPDIAVGEPMWEQQLEPGDVLYVPRGEAHDAVGTTLPSVHLTFGIKASTGVDLFNWVARTAQADPVFRMDISRAGGDELLHKHEM